MKTVRTQCMYGLPIVLVSIKHAAIIRTSAFLRIFNVYIVKEFRTMRRE